MAKVEFFSPDFIPAGAKFTYSVISARYLGKWIFVRHRKRTTWEIAGGHIEAGEEPHEAASRELIEETGARVFDIECIATYSVTIRKSTGWGRLYLAYVHEVGPIPDDSEIAEATLRETLPENLTHPDIQPFLFKRTLDHLILRDGH